MATAPLDVPNSSSMAGIVSGLGADVFVNANTVTRWLLDQPQESRLPLAQALFEKLLNDASQSRQSHGNGHACVRLCSFVQQCAKSGDEGLKQWAFTEQLSKTLFHFYLEWYEHDPHRALRLVLDVLVMTSTLNPCPQTGQSVKEDILETLVSIVARNSTIQLTKSGLQCLDQFLSKKAVSLDDVARKYREKKPSAAELSTIELWRCFVFDLFSWMELCYVSPLAGKCLVHVYRGLDDGLILNESGDFTANIWKRWLEEGLIQYPIILEDIKNYVLVPIFKTEKSASLKLLDVFNRQESLPTTDEGLADQRLLLQLATLELGKKHGLVEEPSSPGEDYSSSTQIVLQDGVLRRFLGHPSLSVRCSAFSLLVSSQATSKPFSQVAFDLLKEYLGAFHADYDAKLRNEVLGLTKGLMRRVKNVITVAQRSFSVPSSSNRGPQHLPIYASRPATRKKFGPEAALKDDVEANEVLDRHAEFLSWYIDFLKGELVPTSSYQRHITALKAAFLILKLGKHAGATGDFLDLDIVTVIASDPTWIRLLFDLMMDPFDDVREAATILLDLFPQEIVQAPTSCMSTSASLLEVLREFCLRAQGLADRTGRADHGDGAARAQGLLCNWLHGQELQIALVSNIIQGLEDKIAKAEHNLGHAAIENPVHADFAALSYAWPVLARQTYSDSQLEALSKIHRRIFDCSKRIWLTVKHVLCDDSPEGHLPEELEEIAGLDTKDLLSYSFRAVHESSNLLRLMVGTLRRTPGAGVLFPPADVFKDAGDLTFEQLATLRHRGAFSTVSLTFTACCQLTRNLQAVFPEAAGSENFLREWYKGTIDCIMTQASTTRRSAGIPSLIAAILSANTDSPSFGEIFSTLEGIAKKDVLLTETDGSNLPQVHALNSLREIFRSSTLSKKAESYLAITLHLAANSLKSEVWAIRNCGLLLLRSLIDSLLGTGESKAIIESGWDGVSIRISYNKYPTLPGVILGLLQSAGQNLGQASQTAAAEAVFPALDIIRRAGPPEEHRAELWEHIEGYLGSRIWHVREIAARTLCSFLLQGDWITEIERLLTQSEKNVTNRLHGVLLTTRFVIERKANLGEDVKLDSLRLKTVLEGPAQRTEVFESCPVIQTAYLEIFNLLSSLGSAGLLTEADLASVISANAVSAGKRIASSSALLEIEIALRLVYDTAASGSLDGLRTWLLKTLTKDTDTACRMLERIPMAWESAVQNRAETRAELCSLYAEVGSRPTAPEARAQALLNLGALIDSVLRQQDVKLVELLPSTEQLNRLWSCLQEGEINPALSCAIIKISGSLMAVVVLRKKGENIADMLRSWGVMIADALDVDNTFDTRFAAATALESFFTAGSSREYLLDASYLPVVSALYNSLIDDDDDVREAAARAASGVLGEVMVPPVAADHLVASLHEQFVGIDEFKLLMGCKMAGQVHLIETAQWVSAEEQLCKAMEFDDSLFAAEEQNLFIDEVRETRRWQRAFLLAAADQQELANFERLSEWTEAGLGFLIRLMAAAGKEEDGPLGWTSDQHVFAICARVVFCAVAIVQVAGAGAGGAGKISGLLKDFTEIGRKTRTHGSLLEMAVIEPVD
ncbi:putative death-receptor fusion protein-domain-containing protein [Bombardia bombarda]|uniref:Death-receptor fusion protein-domain-containing protein n=1 Tax=Bombardia bombarda TaxID=252184 RepID=A0AA40C1A9_9PEZI|nr:putative death-receptor fusion protein-domain-containing protein [Bombardia bombarda]